MRISTKRCPRCSQTKPWIEFGNAAKVTYCTPCRRSYEKGRGPRKRTKAHHREKCLKKKYNLTLDDYALLFEKQDGKCCICSTTEAGNAYGILEVEHDHGTGRVRGLTCRKCNQAIAHFENWSKFPHKEKVIQHLRLE
jgi:hypothetical protein